MLSASSYWNSARRQWLGMPFGGLVTTVVLLFFLATDERMWHWFVVPTYVCGLLITPDAVRWARGEYDPFDIKGMIGVFGWYFFFLAPLVFVYSDIGMPIVEPPPDWRSLVGQLSILNIVAIILYLGGERIGYMLRLTRTHWTVNQRCLNPFSILFIGAAVLSSIYFIARSGGIAGIIQRFDTLRETGQYTFSGLGLFSIIGGATASLLLIYFTFRRKDGVSSSASIINVLLLIIGISGVRLITSGLEGSRSAFVLMMICYAGIIHRYWRSISLGGILAGIMAISLFMYVYGFYKAGGVEYLQRSVQGESITELEQDADRDLTSLLIGDFSRVYVQSYQIYRLQTVDYYSLLWGYTYLNSIIMRTPSWIWPGRPYDDAKVVASTSLLLGPDVYRPGNFWHNSSWVHGILGEAMLNFGILASPLPFFVWGLLIGCYRRALNDWRSNDSRHVLAPFVTVLLFIWLFSDTDNVLSWFIGNLLYVFLFVLVISKRERHK